MEPPFQIPNPQTRFTARKIAKRLVFFFLRGLLITTPFALTIYLVLLAFFWLDSLLSLEARGLGLLVLLASLTLIGYVATHYISRSVLVFVEKAMFRIPFISLIYTSIKDLMGAFVGDKQKFSKPVLVQLNKENSLYRLGFITEEDVDILGLQDMVGVYLPHSYNVSGNFYIVPRAQVSPVPVSGAAAMKFIVSGGVAGIGAADPEKDQT